MLNGYYRTTPHIAHFFPVGMKVKAEVSEVVRTHDLLLVVDENSERNVVYTDNKYVSKQACVACRDYEPLDVIYLQGQYVVWILWYCNINN